jgi:hypothetical protein
LSSDCCVDGQYIPRFYNTTGCKEAKNEDTELYVDFLQLNIVDSIIGLMKILNGIFFFRMILGKNYRHYYWPVALMMISQRLKCI